MEKKEFHYQNDEIKVSYDLNQCIHAGECVKGLRAGVDADTSRMPEIDEEKHANLIIKLMDNGPAILEGSYTLESAEIGSYSSDKGIALCRCGASSNKPFCDGTHKDIGFKG